MWAHWNIEHLFAVKPPHAFQLHLYLKQYPKKKNSKVSIYDPTNKYNCQPPQLFRTYISSVVLYLVAKHTALNCVTKVELFDNVLNTG